MSWRTLGECVFEMVEKKLTKSKEFQDLLAYFGRERLLEEYEKEKKRREELKKMDGQS